MEKMLRPMLRTSGASMFGLQLGQGLGHLATEVVGATDIGLPLSEPGHVALLPTNIKAFGEGLEQSSADVTLYLALRECARQRLFASAGWLRSQMLALVEQYASGITIDTSALEEAVGRLDASNLEELTSSVEGGLFEPQKTPEQRATLERLETMLALVEGWVDEVVSQATAQWMPAASALAEAVRRARATEVRPKRRSPRWWDLSCGLAGCAMLPTCGRRCATPAVSMVGTPSGRIRTWFRHRPILMIHWALSLGMPTLRALRTRTSTVPLNSCSRARAAKATRIRAADRPTGGLELSCRRTLETWSAPNRGTRSVAAALS